MSFLKRVWNGWSEMPTATVYAVVLWLIFDMVDTLVLDVFGEFDGAGVNGIMVTITMVLLWRGWRVESNRRRDERRDRIKL